MKTLFLGLLSLITSVAAVQSPSPVTTPRAALVIRNVSVIDGTGSPARPGLSLVIREGRIAAIVPAGQEPPADLVVNGEGLFAIPGLIDAHVHLSGMPWAQRAEQLERVLRGGVTTVFDMAGDVRDTSHLSRAALTGEILSPGIEYVSLMAGPAFFTDPRVIASSRGYTPGEAPWNRAITADTDLRLCRYFGLSDGWWLRGQAAYDTAIARAGLRHVLAGIQPCAAVPRQRRVPA